MTNHQRLPTKPLHLRTTVPNESSSGSASALQGATSAFHPKPPSVVTAVALTSGSPPSAGAKFAARAVCPVPSRSSPPRPPPGQSVQRYGSPERGRPAMFQRSASELASIAAAAPPSALPTAASASTSTYRSPSAAAAARYASSQSSSPVRSPHRSPQRGLTRRASSRTHMSSLHSASPGFASALSGALASTTMVPSGQEHGSIPVRHRILNFEKLPTLPSPNTKSQLTFDSSDVSKGPNKNASLGPYTPHVSDTSNRRRSQSLADLLSSRPDTLRAISDSSGVSAVTQSSYDTSQTASSVRTFKQMAPSKKAHPARTKASHLAPPDSTHNGMTVNSLADAMVASSLASSRAVSPAKKPPPPAPPRRRSRSFSALYDMTMHDEARKAKRPPKPPRPMKHTLRKLSGSDDDDNGLELTKRGRRHWMRKHPNKHAEGDRKRWRDKVTERERKRYEGVFAANRGLLIGLGYFEPTPSTIATASEGNRVANVVVRDIWERSRLPQDVLMEIYDLVSPEDERSLSRDQFVVGMWLIDQRLKGRKLPTKVSSSVWTSVRHPEGIKLKK